MKRSCWIPILALAGSLMAAETSKTNSPASGTNESAGAKTEAGTIPDATHKPVLTTNQVSLWHALKIIGTRPLDGPGGLLRQHLGSGAARHAVRADA